MLPRIAITVGDPRGIGPEIVAKVLADPPQGAEYLVVGPDDLIRDLPAEGVPIGGQVGRRGERAGEPAALPARDAGLLTALQVEAIRLRA